jgi:hypothetical protein
MDKKYFIIIIVVLAALIAIDISVRVFLNVPADDTVILDNNNPVNQ